MIKFYLQTVTRAGILQEAVFGPYLFISDNLTLFVNILLQFVYVERQLYKRHKLYFLLSFNVPIESLSDKYVYCR